MDNLQNPLIEAAQRAMDHLDSARGTRVLFRMFEVTETVPRYIKEFSPVNAGAREIITLMQESIPLDSKAPKEMLCAAFNTLVDMATERGLATEFRDMILAINPPERIAVFKPLALQKRG
ncbi:MAG: hypothetical protein ACAH83_17425 [Alphaproteobacteria bacterium]